MPLKLINNQTLIIAGTDITIEDPFIICSEPEIRMVDPNQWKIRCMFPVFQTVAKFRESIVKNNVKTELLYKKSAIYDYDETSDGILSEFMDIKMKESLVAWGIPGANISFIPAHA